MVPPAPIERVMLQRAAGCESAVAWDAAVGYADTRLSRSRRGGHTQLSRLPRFKPDSAAIAFRIACAKCKDARVAMKLVDRIRVSGGMVPDAEARRGMLALTAAGSSKTSLKLLAAAIAHARRLHLERAPQLRVAPAPAPPAVAAPPSPALPPSPLLPPASTPADESQPLDVLGLDEKISIAAAEGRWEDSLLLIAQLMRSAATAKSPLQPAEAAVLAMLSSTSSWKSALELYSQ